MRVENGYLFIGHKNLNEERGITFYCGLPKTKDLWYTLYKKTMKGENYEAGRITGSDITFSGRIKEFI